MNDRGFDLSMILLKLGEDLRMVWSQSRVDDDLSFLLGRLDRFLPFQLPGCFFGRGGFFRPANKESKRKRGEGRCTWFSS